MGKPKKPLYEPETGIHRAKGWEMALYAFNNTSTNVYLFLFMYIQYYLVGIVGAATVLAGTIVMAMRMWDGVTDPFVGYIIDKTNSKFGKNRPFIVIGNVILLATSGLMYFIVPNMAQVARLPLFIVLYALYIIGYTAQCVVTKSAQSCLTNDPKQRPTFTIFDTIYNTLLFAGLPVYVTNVLVVNHGGGEAFSNPAFFQDFWLVCAVLSAVFAALAILALWRKDREEYFGVGKAVRVGFKDYWDVLRNNRAIQMLVFSAASDKLSLTMQGNATIMVVLFGVIVGNYAQYGLVSAMLSIPTVIVSLILIRIIAVGFGQKAGIVVSTWGCIISAVAVLALFIFGDPTSLDLSFAGGSMIFTVAFIVFWVAMRSFSSVASGIVIPMTADCADYEVYRSGRYVPGLMGTLFSFVDKMISSFATTFVSLMLAAIGFSEVLPTQDTPYSTGLFWVTMGCVIGAPLVGWLINLIAMKFYPLNQEKMAEIQEHIAEIKAKAMAEETA